MTLNSAEIGERYSDDSGWERRVMINVQTGTLEIDLLGSHLSGPARDLDWLIEALIKIRDSVKP